MLPYLAKKEFAGVIKLRLLRWGELSWVGPKWNHMCPYHGIFDTEEKETM